MRSFARASTIRETTIVVSVSLTFITLLWFAVAIRSVIQRGNLLRARIFGGELEIKEILGDSKFLLLMESLEAFTDPVIDVYTHWSIDEVAEHVARVHPVDVA